jgi:hypothetical protein
VAIRLPARNGGGESALNYAIWPGLHELAANIDPDRCRPYMAAHEKRFCDQRCCQAPPPSLPRYGTSAHPRVKTQKFVPPVPAARFLLSCLGSGLIPRRESKAYVCD